jgi:hypothetical protein
MPHMDEGRLQAWLDAPRSGLSDAERDEISAHLDACEVCAARLEGLRATDGAAADLLGALGGAEPATPDFSEVVARSRSIEGGAEAETPPIRRRFPVQWAASIVVAIGVGWMANEVVRKEPRVIVVPEAPGPTADGALAEQMDASAAESAPALDTGLTPALDAGLAPAESESAPDAVARPATPLVAEAQPAELSVAPTRANEIRGSGATAPPPSVGIELPERRTVEAAAGARSFAQRRAELPAAPGRMDSIASASNPVLSVDGVRIDPGATWRRTSTTGAEEVLGELPMRIAGLEWTEIAALTIGQIAVVRVTHRTADGGEVLLYQSRSDLEAEEAPGRTHLTRRTDSGVTLLAVAGFDPEGLDALLRQVAPIG